MTPALHAALSREATGYRRALRMVLWLCVGLALCAAAAARPVVMQGEAGRGFQLEFDYLLDPDGHYSLDQVRERPDSDFRNSGPDGAALSFLKGAVWLRFSVLNQSSPGTAWLLQFNDALLDDIRVYQPTEDGGWRETRLGDQQRLAAEAVDSISPAMQFDPPHGRETTVFVRVQSKSSMLLDVRLLTARQFYSASILSILWYGAIFGIMAAMCLYSLAL